MSELFSVSSRGYNFIGKAPNVCPICHHTVIIKNLQVFRQVENVMQFLFECPNSDCGSLIIGYYKVYDSSDLEYLYSLPAKIKVKVFPEIISTLSQNFISIFNEAEEAKQRGLLQIAGPGYRKAFEFLIKDYAKQISNEDIHKEIEKTPSNSVVNKFIQDPRIQSVAKRALWLGNDETHYLRKWENHDITDLLMLINLTINWIEIDYLSKSYADEMPE